MSLTPRLSIANLDVASLSKEIVINANYSIIDSAVTRVTGDTMTGQLNINVTSGTALNLQITDAGGGPDLDTLRPDQLYLRHLTSATTVAGVGSGIAWRVKDAAGTELTIGRAVAEITTITAGSVDSTQAWTVRKGGTEVEAFRIRGGFGRAVTNDPANSIAAGNVGGDMMLRCSQTNLWTTTFSRQAVTSGNPGATFTVTTPADTGLTASAESNMVLFDFGAATRQWATGAIATQRAFVINGPTYSFVGASTITSAATVHIFGSPVAGTNATITNSAALWVQGQMVLGNNIAGTTLAGFTFAQGQSSASPTAFYIQPVRGGTFAAGVESPMMVFDSANATYTWATGALATQRDSLFKAPTIAFVGASTATDVATVAITGAPIAGSNATLTNSYALWVQGGGIRSQGHLNFAGGTAPTAAAGANAGASPPAPVVTGGANDTRMNFTWGTGTGPAAGAQVSGTFAAAYGAAPFVYVTPRNTATQALGLYISATSTTGFTLSTTNAPAASQANTVYAVDVWVVQ